MPANDLDQLVATLRRYAPFCDYADDNLLVLASRAHVDRVGPGQTLFRAGEDDVWTVCLLDGDIELAAADGRTLIVPSGSAAAGKPLSPLKPRLHTARTRGAATLLFIDMTGLAPLHDLARPRAQQLDVDYLDIAIDEGEATLERPVGPHDELLAGEVPVPTLPDVALRTRRLIDSDDAAIGQVAAAVSSDPAIAAKLIKAANSPLYRGQSPIGTCDAAIRRLGLRSVRSLVLAFALRELFETSSPALAARMRRTWEHCNEVAAIAYVIARLTDACDPEEALLAGLLHDIGVLPILNQCSRNPDLAASPAEVEALVAALRADVGAATLDKWNFPAPFVTAVREADDWWRDPAARTELADIVVVAQVHAAIGKAERRALPPLPRMPAFRRLFPGEHGPELGQRILAEAAEQIAEARDLLAA